MARLASQAFLTMLRVTLFLPVTGILLALVSFASILDFVICAH
jgi:hypothetical protein